jgi:hypothetical protein
MLDFIKNDEFNFWVPMDISKADPKNPKDSRRFIQGIASTTDIDLQSETVDQHGIDFSYFLKHGYFNNDHKPGFKNKVGQPIECKISKEGLWTKGFLFQKHEVADAIWELAQALEISKADRKLGFSIQGKVTRREGRKIAKCWIQDIAITAAPINTNTWLDIVKSLNSVPDEYWSPEESFEISPRLISPIYNAGGCGMCSAAKKSLSIDESKMDLKKDKVCTGMCKHGKSSENEDEEEDQKAMASADIKAPESLDSDVHDINWGGSSERVKELSNKSLTFDECVEFLCEYRQLSKSNAIVVAKAALNTIGQP